MKKTIYSVLLVGLLTGCSVTLPGEHKMSLPVQENLIPKPTPTDIILINGPKRNGQLESTGNTFSNIVNGGFAASDGVWQYGILYEGSAFCCLYRVRYDGTGYQVLRQIEASDIHVYGDYLYYRARNGANLYRMKTDGSELTCINSDYARQVQFYNGLLYYVNEKTCMLYQSALDGTDKKKVFYVYPGTLLIDDGWIYQMISLDQFKYSVDEAMASMVGRLLRMKLDGSGTVTYFNEDAEDAGVNFVMDEMHLYYIQADDGAIWRMNKDGTQKTRLGGANAYCLAVANGVVYYGVYQPIQESELRDDPARGLYCLYPDGTQVQWNNRNVYAINITEDAIYTYEINERNTPSIHRIAKDNSEDVLLSNANFGGSPLAFDKKGFVLYASDSRYVAKWEIERLLETRQPHVLTYARSEILARHGQMFPVFGPYDERYDSDVRAKYWNELHAHYTQYDWYNRLEKRAVRRDMLNDYELANLELIESYELPLLNVR